MVNEKGALEQRFSILSQEIDALSSRLGSILPGRLFRVHLANQRNRRSLINFGSRPATLGATAFSARARNL